MDIEQSQHHLNVKNHKIFYRLWCCQSKAAKAIVHIHHGMAEHSLRYNSLANHLVAEGYLVIAQDHRGHGKSVKNQNDLGHLDDEAGWQQVIDDSFLVSETILQQHPNLPLVLFGHSMGSFICLNRVQLEKQRPHLQSAGLILSGSALTPLIKRLVLNRTAHLERLRQGKRGHSPLIKKITFEDFNKGIKAPQTEADWLSRDTDEVDKYLKDPLCGFACTNETWVQLSDALLNIFSKKSLSNIPKTLPTLVLFGDDDPMGGGRSNRRLIKKLGGIGIQHVDSRGYQGARHEILNEIARDQVAADIQNWSDKLIGS